MTGAVKRRHYERQRSRLLDLVANQMLRQKIREIFRAVFGVPQAQPIEIHPMSANLVEKSDYFGSIRTEIAEHLPPGLGDVLEIGCGRGNTMRWIKSQHKVGSSTGVEIDRDSGEDARAHFDEIDIGSVEASTVLSRELSFDIVLALDVLEHLVDPAKQLNRLKQCLRPAGLLVASIPNVGNFSVSWPLFFQGQWKYADEGHLDRTHLRFFDQETVRALLDEAGFRVVKMTYTVKCPNLFGFLGWRSDAARWYSRRLFQLAAPRHMWISQFVFSATLKS